MLLTVRERGQVTIKELAEALQVSAPSASAMVDRLVEMGALTREQNPNDRREVAVALSPQAQQVTAMMEEGLLGGIVDLIEKLGPEYAAMWCKVYDKIGKILAKNEEHDGGEQERNQEHVARAGS
jgi:DNA-binding MarR family transcriptional regulator